MTAPSLRKTWEPQPRFLPFLFFPLLSTKLRRRLHKSLIFENFRHPGTPAAATTTSSSPRVTKKQQSKCDLRALPANLPTVARVVTPGSTATTSSLTAIWRDETELPTLLGATRVRSCIVNLGFPDREPPRTRRWMKTCAPPAGAVLESVASGIRK